MSNDHAPVPAPAPEPAPSPAPVPPPPAVSPAPAPVPPAPPLTRYQAVSDPDALGLQRQHVERTAAIAEAYADIKRAELAPRPDHEVWLSALIARTTGSNTPTSAVTYANAVLAAYQAKFPRQV